MNILFLLPYPLTQSPSQRFRFEQYFNTLGKEAISCRAQSFFDESTYEILYTKGDFIKKALAIMKGYFRRTIVLLKLLNVSYIFVHREITPFGPPIFEWLIAKVFRKKIIYDFDDAIWMPQEGYGSKVKNLLKNPYKVNSIIKWSYKVSCGNEYLCNHARKYNKNVVLNPTTIDTINLHNKIKNQASSRIVIGWTGSHSTLMYLDPIAPVIARLEKEFEFDFIVICNKNPEYSLRSFKFIPWNKDSEIDDLLLFNFGLMPLIKDKWTEGKCGFKALQYMALGMPAVVSPVGVNKVIVDNGVDGFCCQIDEEWYTAIKTLILSESIRTKMGKNAREKIVKYYSVESNKDNFLTLFS